MPLRALRRSINTRRSGRVLGLLSLSLRTRLAARAKVAMASRHACADPTPTAVLVRTSYYTYGRYRPRTSIALLCIAFWVVHILTYLRHFTTTTQTSLHAHRHAIHPRPEPLSALFGMRATSSTLSSLSLARNADHHDVYAGLLDGLQKPLERSESSTKGARYLEFARPLGVDNGLKGDLMDDGAGFDNRFGFF